MNRHERLMDGALAEARAGLAQGEQPFGAVIAGASGEIVARARSLKVSTGDPTAHSELLAIRAATGSLGRRTLEDCTFYGTCEPCPMCLGTMFNAGLPRLVLGARLRDLGDIAFAFGITPWRASPPWSAGRSSWSRASARPTAPPCIAHPA